MANDYYTQQALFNDQVFRRRFKASLAKVSLTVLTEGAGVTNHNARKAYALLVIANLDQYVNVIAGSAVMRSGGNNLFAFATSVALVQGVPVVSTLAADIDIETQLLADWDLYAGAGA